MLSGFLRVAKTVGTCTCNRASSEGKTEPLKVIMTLTPSVTVGLRCENQFDFEKTERLANFMSAVRNV